jgi:hypothetical protein
MIRKAQQFFLFQPDLAQQNPVFMQKSSHPYVENCPV